MTWHMGLLVILLAAWLWGLCISSFAYAADADAGDMSSAPMMQGAALATDADGRVLIVRCAQTGSSFLDACLTQHGSHDMVKVLFSLFLMMVVCACLRLIRMA